MFDTTLIASNPRREVKRKFATLPAALAIHAMALGFVMVGQLWAVNDVPEPYVPIIFAAPAPPPALGHPGGKGATPTKPLHPVVRQPEVQIASVPNEPAKPVDPSAVSDDPSAVVGGNPDGTDTGIPGSVPPEVVVAPPREEPPADAPILISPNVVGPVPLVRTLPAYPEIARRLRKEGVVIVQATIDREGNVIDTQVHKDIGLGCGDAAEEAIRGWRYRPATLDGRPVSVYLTVTINFELRGVS